MKKLNLYILLSMTLGVLFFPLEGASGAQTSDLQSATSPSQQIINDDDEDDDDDFDDDDFDDDDEDDDDDYYDIMDRNQVDGTDVLAIPLDDSEVEDEEEINKAEKRDTFKLPHAR